METEEHKKGNAGETTLVVAPLLKSKSRGHDVNVILEEAVGLAAAINLNIVHKAPILLALPSPSTFLSKGHVENLGAIIAEKNIKLAIIDHALAPVQQRNLETEWKCKVIDRTGLILEIFGARAMTKEGQLQVELAALDYQKSRLVRSWTHLERQRGGFGFLGGPGESQLELDRRIIGQRMIKIKEQLVQVRRTRGLQREARVRAEHPTIALVGYTNAGKSTLFNRLTGADVLVKDMLFATLDPTMRGMKLPHGKEVVISDTVGFISDLPTHLIEAFRATLEEVQLANVILHVRDVAHSESKAQKQSVLDILKDLGVAPDDKRLLEVQNKADLLPPEDRAHLKTYAARVTVETEQVLPVDGVRPEAHGGVVVVSALTGEGMEVLLERLEYVLARQNKVYEISLPLSEGAALSWLYAHGKVVDKKDTKTKMKIKVEMGLADWGRFQSRFKKAADEKN